MNKGFTLMEVLVVITIFTVILSIAVLSFSGLNDRESLEKDVAGLTALIRNARTLSTTSKEASVFSIHLENDRAVLFKGSSYSQVTPSEKVVTFSGKVRVSSYSLNGGGSNIIFDRLTGETSNYGDITLSLTNNSASTTITVLKTGAVQ